MIAGNEKLFLGPRGAPHVFCRVTDLICTVAAIIFLIPVVPHVDDMCGVEEEAAVDSARDCFVALLEALNFRLKFSKAAPPRSMQNGASHLVALGGLVDFRTTLAQRMSGLICWVDLPEEKAKK